VFLGFQRLVQSLGVAAGLPSLRPVNSSISTILPWRTCNRRRARTVWLARQRLLDVVPSETFEDVVEVALGQHAGLAQHCPRRARSPGSVIETVRNFSSLS